MRDERGPGPKRAQSRVLEARPLTIEEWARLGPSRRDWRQANRALQRWHQPPTTLAPVRWLDDPEDGHA
jgi:hypothetical protein